MGNEKKNKAKLSSKGVSKRQNKLTWDRYEAPLNGVEDKATTRGGGGVKDGERHDANIYPKQAGAKCVLQQTVGAAGRDPHGAY